MKTAKQKHLSPVLSEGNKFPSNAGRLEPARIQANTLANQEHGTFDALNEQTLLAKEIRQLNDEAGLNVRSTPAIKSVERMAPKNAVPKQSSSRANGLFAVGIAQKILAHQKAAVLSASGVKAVERALSRHRVSALDAAEFNDAERILDTSASTSTALSEARKIRRKLVAYRRSANETVSISVAERAQAYADATRDDFAQRVAKATQNLTGSESSAMAGVRSMKKSHKR